MHSLLTKLGLSYEAGAPPRLPRRPLALLNAPSPPSILKQTPWSCGFYRFPDEGASWQLLIEYFNPTIVRRQDGLHLITRRRYVPEGTYGKNTLWSWKLDGSKVTHGHQIHIKPFLHGEHWEDPRIAVLPGGRELLSWCNFTLRTFAHQSHGELLAGRRVGHVWHLSAGRNGSHLKANHGHEKNWTWFWADDGLRCSYLLAPQHHVLKVRNNVVQERSVSDSSWAQKLWRWGEIRGGSSPVSIGAHFVVFFHSHLPWRFDGRRWFNIYYMGALLFESRPPFKVTHVTPRPLLAGSDEDPRNMGAPLCVFPCGAVLDGADWLVVLGVNDCRCAWLRVPHDELLKLMVVEGASH